MNSSITRTNIVMIAAIVLIIALVLSAKALGITKTNKALTSTPVPTAMMSGMNHMAPITSEQEFLVEMVPHHQDAIDSSTTIVQRSQNAAVRDLASKIITAQTLEVTNMRSWYQTWYGVELPASSQYVAMMTNLSSTPLNDLDAMYIDEMIAHHQAAITMAKQVQPLAEHQEIKDIAASIISTQQAEIVEMQKLQAPQSGTTMQHDMSGMKH